MDMDYSMNGRFASRAMEAMDLCSSPPPSLSGFLTEFALFPHLPLELRLQIYSEFNKMSPRVLSVKPGAHSSLLCASTHPALLSVSAESRAETLKSHYPIRDLEGNPRFYYNPLLDTIHLTSDTKYSSDASSTSTPPQDAWLLSLTQITSSLPPSLGIYSLALRGVKTLPPAGIFFESGGAKVREMLMLVGPGGHRRGPSTYCGVGVGFMRKMMVREVERSLELMEAGFETGRAPVLLALVGGGKDDEGLEERLLDERGWGEVIV
ncbi:hypothetical protein LZ554_004194 [Drepanopeziza brunnea f. sp. 'monogermtubi']|nr:hypothetical protein LZ554_004194 [Drepanopeziza brunnea f. sp. 'monogermtubi']